jgi:hypothetical protein
VIFHRASSAFLTLKGTRKWNALCMKYVRYLRKSYPAKLREGKSADQKLTIGWTPRAIKPTDCRPSTLWQPDL